MATLDRDKSLDRLKSAIGVVGFHLLVGYAFINGLGVDVAERIDDKLKLFDVTEPPPPPLPDPIEVKPMPEAKEGAAAPPSLKAKPTPLVAPPPKIRLEVPPPLVTAPRPLPGPTGNDPSAGASPTDGPGTGAGGVGDGTGSGGQGTGTGGGGGRPAQRVGGAIDGARDYPAAARRAGVEGSVAVRFTVETDGRAERCEVIRSSGSDELDETTCRLIERRFRYRPARDRAGRPVPETVRRTFDWLLPLRD